MNFLIIVVMVHNVLQSSGSPNIFLTKYQLSFFFGLLLTEQIDFLLVNQQINSQLKLVLRRCKQNLVSKYLVNHEILVVPLPRMSYMLQILQGLLNINHIFSHQTRSNR